MCCLETRYGLGLPLKLRPEANLITYTEVNYAGRPIYQLGISFFKIALLISYLRLLQGTSQRMYRIVVYVVIGIVFVSHLACAFSLIFACTPVERSWRPNVEGTCLPPGPSFTAYAVVTIVSDVVVAVLPVPMLVSLNIQLSKKLGLIGIFILGLFTTLCSVFRYLQIDRIQYGDGNSTMLILWGVVEFNVGVGLSISHALPRSLTQSQNLVSSLPFLAPIFIKKAKDYRSKPSSGSGYGRSRSRHLKGSEAYKLSERGGNNRGAFVSADHKSATGSEENILQSNNAILKSVTYTVQVDEEPASEAGSAQQRLRDDLESRN